MVEKEALVYSLLKQEILKTLFWMCAKPVRTLGLMMLKVGLNMQWTYVQLGQYITISAVPIFELGETYQLYTDNQVKAVNIHLAGLLMY